MTQAIPPDERDAMIEALAKRADRMEGAAVLLEKERDSLRVQLAAAQAALEVIAAREQGSSVTALKEPNSAYTARQALAAIATDQSAAGSDE